MPLKPVAHLLRALLLVFVLGNCAFGQSDNQPAYRDVNRAD